MMTWDLQARSVKRNSIGLRGATKTMALIGSEQLSADFSNFIAGFTESPETSVSIAVSKHDPVSDPGHGAKE
ncbi:hypothetical protein GSI_05540 [Ganoderma sinense ZZ0214-1]|uniref:Uncharacterized protein n=1 Tax=Ganoderma sinense ZZ0214-1 TaxID=1077348 RepID=A0A2G8SEU5_9APHY|nr:hypothetical protein GSI_05540 [Ganoderma sinense ZZ0214-1]